MVPGGALETVGQHVLQRQAAQIAKLQLTLPPFEIPPRLLFILFVPRIDSGHEIDAFGPGNQLERALA